MRKFKLLVLPAVGALFLVAAMPAFAHEGGADFVCPVFKSDAVGQHNPNAVQPGEFYTILPGNSGHLDVPDHATNKDGSGGPGGSNYASPGDTDYSAIWNGG